jgi:uroporphyrinogen decarboxylase
MDVKVVQSRFLKVCRGEAVDATPIWLMRQAGRYMPEYRAIRATHSMLTCIRTPELACEITMQPIRAFDLDAAIIFSDILPILQGMGLELDFVDGEGPQIFNPIRSRAEVERLVVRPAEETLGYVMQAIGLVVRELEPRGLPLIGFSGAPFTLAAYAIEGKGSKDYRQAKGMMMADPASWHLLMEKLSPAVGEYLVAQARAGASALQVFDSWAGELSPGDYREHVLPYTKRVIEAAAGTGVPVIHFGVGTAGLLEDIATAGSDVIGVDWTTDLSSAYARVGAGRTLQGNLDPVALLAPWEALRARASAVLEQAARRPAGSGHIFNLGHGILPPTPTENVRRLVDFVHEFGVGAA